MACARVLLISLNGLFAIAAIGLIVASSIALYFTTIKLLIFPIALGSVVLISNILGMCGAGADTNARKRPVLIIYFFLTLISALGLIFIGAMLLVSYDMMLTIINGALQPFRDMFKDWAALPDAEFIAKVAEALAPYAYVVSGISLGLAALLIIGMMLAGAILSLKTVVALLLGFQNFLTIACGGALLGFGIYGLVSPAALVVTAKWIPIVMIACGSLVVLISGLGFFGSCAKSKCLLISYTCFLGLVILITAAIAIAVFVFLGQLVTFIQNHIEEFKHMFPQWTADPDFVTRVADFLQSNMKLLAVGAIVFGVFLLWSFIASIYLAVTMGRRNEESLLAHSDMDANYALSSAHSAYAGPSSSYMSADKRRAQTFY
ncbi:hypothetical protein PAPYR_5199 [Paratrimastix pyriformis]|uniref:DUF4203 domain-containing protein n=1 Tax=Paratrimastix pyriformis TaxID=342808 RepID=A0ABQ8UKG6_9EUKA|nr:hypothetical protein PAPYR_5199 [Paratrimastix pyriformis]